MIIVERHEYIFWKGNHKYLIALKILKQLLKNKMDITLEL
jgi:hypothetical protein